MPPILEWPTSPVDGERYNNRIWDADIGAWVEDILYETKTVDITTALTTTEIQALINKQPKNLNGNQLIFQFADGTYELDALVEFLDFTGGILSVYGNASDAVVGGAKLVKIRSAATLIDSRVMVFKRCSNVLFFYIEIDNNYCTVNSVETLVFIQCDYVSVNWSSLETGGTVPAVCVEFNATRGLVTNSNFSSAHRHVNVISMSNVSVTLACTMTNSVTGNNLYSSSSFLTYTGTASTDLLTTLTTNGGLILDDTGIIDGA